MRTSIPSLSLPFVLLILLVAGPVSGRAATSVSAAGISFTFDTNYHTGYYPDGMPWVVENNPGGGVRITAMSPAFGGTAHGWEENPVAEYSVSRDHPQCGSSRSCQAQSLDERLKLSRWAYLSPTERYGALPRTVRAGTSVLKVKSCSGSTCPSSGVSGTILSAAVLTVLASAPPEGAIRPPYMGTQKPHFVIADLDIANDLPNLPFLSSSSQYSHDEIRASFGNFPAPSNVFLKTEFSGRATPVGITRPRIGSHASYGCDYGMWLQAALLSTAQVGSVAEKRDVIYQLLANAVDHFYATKSGRDWGSGGCGYHGRKSLILWAGRILNGLDQGAAQAAAAEMAAFRDGVEPLDQMTYLSAVTGEALWGLPPCLDDPASNTSTRRHCDQRRDGGGSKWGSGAKGASLVQDTPSSLISAGKFSYAAYQMMSAVYFGAAAVARIYDLETAWNEGRPDRSDAFFRYTDRIAAPPWNRACNSHCDGFLTKMHAEYGCNSQQCASRRGASAEVPPDPPVLLEVE